jgi:rhodanese-related sulfurtransferase
LRADRENEVKTQLIDGIPVVSPAQVAEFLAQDPKKIRIIDVRRPEEFNNELGHIASAKLITLGSALTEWLQGGDRNEQIVFVCRSGARSGGSTKEAMALGFKNVANLTGGMILWNTEKLPIERS